MVRFEGGEEIYLECDGQRLKEYRVTDDSLAPIDALPQSHMTKATYAKSTYIPAERGKTFVIVGNGFRIAFSGAKKAKAKTEMYASSMGNTKVECNVWSSGLYCRGTLSHDDNSIVRDGYTNDGMMYKFQFAQQTTGQLPRVEGEDGELDTAKLIFSPAEFVVTISAFERDPYTPDSLRLNDHGLQGQLQTVKAGSKAHFYGCGATGAAAGMAQSRAASGRRRTDLPVYRVKFLLSSARLLVLQGIMPEDDVVGSWSRIDGPLEEPRSTDTTNADQDTGPSTAFSSTDVRAKVDPDADVLSVFSSVKTENRAIRGGASSSRVSGSLTTRPRNDENADPRASSSSGQPPTKKQKKFEKHEVIDLTDD